MRTTRFVLMLVTVALPFAACQAGSLTMQNVTNSANLYSRKGPNEDAPQRVSENGIESVFRGIRTAIENDDYANAAQLLRKAIALADKDQSAVPRKLVDALSPRIRYLSQNYPIKCKTQGAIGQRDLGRFYCFFKNDWSNGCVLLKGCNDPNLVDIAERETVQPQDAARQASLGDKWIKLAKASTGYERTAMEARALQWYAKAYSGLTAEQKRRIDPMLTDAVSRQMNRNLGAPADPVDLFLKLDWPDLLVALGLEFMSAHSKPSERQTYCHITVTVKNLTGMGECKGLRAESRLLCTDGNKNWNVIRYFTDLPINVPGKQMLNVGTSQHNVRQRNSKSNVPRNAYIEYSVGGCTIYRAFLSKPENQPWWLDETLIQ